MKVHSFSGWFFAAVVLLVVLWQLGQAVFMGRMGDVLFDEEDYLFFFERPILFIIQFVVLAFVGYLIVYFGWKEFRKGRKAKADRTPRHTHDARPPRKDA